MSNGDRPISNVLSKLDRVHQTGRAQWKARCPAHEDRDPSLSVSEGKDGRVLLTCFAGCSVESIVAALGFRVSDLFRKNGKPNEVVAEYTYVDEASETLFVVERLYPKTFRQKRPDGTGGWIRNRKGVRPVLYRLPSVLEAIGRGETIYVVEGEKDVAALERLGLTATTNPGGAGKWREEYAETLRRANVVVVADRDEKGRDHAQAVARSLSATASSVKVVEPAEGKDPHDHVKQGLTATDFVEVADDSSIPSDFTATVQPPALADEPRILDRLKADLARCGLVGEDRVATMVYLTITSRLLKDPVSSAVKGTSSTGKSRTVETITRFFPKDAIIAMTSMSERALVYLDEDLQHKTIVLYEAVALRERVDDNLTAYLVRTLLSEGRLIHRVTTKKKDGSGYKTVVVEKEGPTNLVLTTTSTSLHGENETRLISMTTNDTQEQTRRVLMQLASDDPGEADLTEWLALQAWLETAEHRVAIPYATALAAAMPPVAVRLRRDFKAVLTLIKAHAVLHQQSRERDELGRVVATWDDYAVVRELVADLISEGVGATVPETIRETVACVGQLAAGSSEGVKVVDVARVLRLDKSAASRRLSSARDRGFVVNLEERRGRPARYALGEPMPDELELLPPLPAQACNTSADERAGQQDGCTVAAESEGIENPSPVNGQVEDERAAAIELFTKEMGAEVVAPPPRGSELLAAAAGLGFPRTDLPDKTTILDEDCWRVFCAVALPHDRAAAFQRLKELETSAQ